MTEDIIKELEDTLSEENNQLRASYFVLRTVTSELDNFQEMTT